MRTVCAARLENTVTLGGRITDLGDAPERLNEDPYGEGWIFVIELSDPVQLDSLLTAAAYRELVEG